MKRDHIDFTKTKSCCLCGCKGNGLSEAEIGKFGLYTACRVLMCQKCVELCGAKEKDGRLFVKNVDELPTKVAKMSADFAEAMKKALVAEMEKHASDLAPWIAEPFKLVGGETFSQVAMKKWTDAKDKAFAEKLEVINYFKSKHPASMACPVCGKPLVLDAPDETELEINDVLKFKCPDGCLSFDETELSSLYRDSYEDYIRRLGAGFSRYRNYDRLRLETEKNSLRALSCTAYALDVVEITLSGLAYELYGVIDCAMFDAKCGNMCKGKTTAMCNECHKKFEAEHPELRERHMREIYGFKKGMNLHDLMDAIRQSNNYRASKHCKLWCAVSPDNAQRGVCGATSRPCEKYDGRESCRKCSSHVEGKPLGNFLATAGMCQHYKDGKCLKNCGKDGKWKWKGREDIDVCTFKASHYVFSDKGRFCKNFKMRDDLDLNAALDASRNGKSYNGFYR